MRDGWRKQAEAVGAGTVDPAPADAAMSPVPPPAISNKPAPGQRGPKGLAPRTTYTRVNTGAPPALDAGESSLKTIAPPVKLAHKEYPMTHIKRPNVHALIKEAMEGTVSKLASRPTPVAAPEPLDAEYSTEYVVKIARAVMDIAKVAEGLEPGEGPGALDVMEAEEDEYGIDANEMGVAKHRPPRVPGLERSGEFDPTNTLETDEDREYEPKQASAPVGKLRRLGQLLSGSEAKRLGAKVDDWSRAHSALRKQVGGTRVGAVDALHAWERAAATARHANELKAVTKARRIAGGAAAGTLAVGGGTAAALKHRANKKRAAGEEKQASLYEHNLYALIKRAEDGAPDISSSRASDVPAGVSASEEGAPSVPADVARQQRLVSTVDGAIDYTKRQAKAVPKEDMDEFLDEPALSDSTDKTLDLTLAHTDEAGAKIASQLARTAAAEVLLNKLAGQGMHKEGRFVLPMAVGGVLGGAALGEREHRKHGLEGGALSGALTGGVRTGGGALLGALPGALVGSSALANVGAVGGGLLGARSAGGAIERRALQEAAVRRAEERYLADRAAAAEGEPKLAGIYGASYGAHEANEAAKMHGVKAQSGRAAMYGAVRPGLGAAGGTLKGGTKGALKGGAAGALAGTIAGIPLGPLGMAAGAVGGGAIGAVGGGLSGAATGGLKGHSKGLSATRNYAHQSAQRRAALQHGGE